MRVLYGEGLASRTGPVPCAADREVIGEALARGVVGWVLSRESGLSGADRVGKPGRQHGCGRQGEPANRPGVVRDPRHAAMLLAREKSDLAVVAGKLPNKSGRPDAEATEPRAGAKENAEQRNTRRTQGRESVLQPLGRIRHAFDVKHPRQEPSALAAHARICAGGAA